MTVDYTPRFTFANVNHKLNKTMTKSILKLSAMGVLIASLALTSCEAVKKCCGNDNKTKSCSPSCSTNPQSKNNKMTTENETCPKCGKTSCDKNCSTENTSINGITDDLCSTKTMEQIKAEAEAFKKMDAYKNISSIKEIETGYELIYNKPNSKFTLELIDFLKLEVKCCPTYDYALVIDSKNNVIRYQRFGSPKIKAELKEYFEMVGLLK